MRKRYVLAIIMSVVLATGSVTAFASENAIAEDAESASTVLDIDVESIDDAVFEALELDQADVNEYEVELTEGYVSADDGTETDGMGILQFSSYDEENEMMEVESYIFLDDDGAPLSAAAVSQAVCTSALQGTSSIKIQSKYKLYYTDSVSNVYVNPYSVSVTPKVSGISYFQGYVKFHGTQVKTSDFKDITGTDCSFAMKKKTVSSGITKGTTYSSTGYVYTATALRIYSDSSHKNAFMYLTYKLNGTTYSSTYDIANL